MRVPMRVDVLTIFPAIFEGPLRESLLGRAIDDGLLDVRVHDLRDWSTDPHRSVDDESFGGGPGMVMKPEPIFAAVESLGRRDRRRRAAALARPGGARPGLVPASWPPSRTWSSLCGRYEGVDERVVEGLPAEEVSIGDYVLSGGEAAGAGAARGGDAARARAWSGNEESLEQDSFASRACSTTRTTRGPREFRGMDVPEVLLSGDHAEVDRLATRGGRWTKTRRHRPDLLATGPRRSARALG